MTGMILDGVLMLLLVAALGYGVRLEKKLSALRAGQLAFASAVTELNTAAGRAEAALATLRASGHETDLLHDRVVKARELKAQLETLIARGGDFSLPRSADERSRSEPGAEVQNLAAAQQLNTVPPGLGSALPSLPIKGRESPEDEGRADRMAALADRIRGLNMTSQPAPGRGDVAAILGALKSGGAANQAAKQSLNRPRRNLDEDLFAA